MQQVFGSDCGPQKAPLGSSPQSEGPVTQDTLLFSLQGCLFQSSPMDLWEGFIGQKEMQMALSALWV